jgi:hypothetical protein
LRAELGGAKHGIDDLTLVDRIQPGAAHVVRPIATNKINHAPLPRPRRIQA